MPVLRPRQRRRWTALLKDYGKDIAVAFRHNPLPFHKNAMPAALAAEAAREQGKFWEMHDKLFAEPAARSTARPRQVRRRSSGSTWRSSRRRWTSEKGKERIKRDMDDAGKFGARGTPNFFINGRNLRGAQPIEAFKSAIDEEIKKADAKLKRRHAARAALRRAHQGGLDKAAAPPPPPPAPGEPDANTRLRAEIKGAPMKGAKDALVTIVQWSRLPVPVLQRASSRPSTR